MRKDSPNTISVSDIEVTAGAHSTRVSAQVSGRELYFDIAGQPSIGDPASAFLACCIYPAMRLGVPLVVDSGHHVSQQLAQNLETFQDIFTLWYPELRRVPIEATTSPDRPVATAGYASMFSGGVDSCYTYLSTEDDLKQIVFVGGLDISETEQTRYRESLTRYSDFATARGKHLVTLWTNIKGFWPDVKMSPHHGQVLAGIGIMLGFHRTYIPASHTYAELDAWGSHPLTDPLFSTESTTTIHHGAYPRRMKLRTVSRDSACLNMLRVCNSSAMYNCGQCEKCLRTMMSLRLLRVTSSALPNLENLTLIRKLRIYSDSDLTFWRDNLALAEEMGDAESRKAIKGVVRGYEMRRALRRLWSIFR